MPTLGSAYKRCSLTSPFLPNPFCNLKHIFFPSFPVLTKDVWLESLTDFCFLFSVELTVTFLPTVPIWNRFCSSHSWDVHLSPLPCSPSMISVSLLVFDKMFTKTYFYILFVFSLKTTCEPDGLINSISSQHPVPNLSMIFPSPFQPFSTLSAT